MRQRSQCMRWPPSGWIALRSGQLQLDGARAVVEAAGEVLEHLGLDPAVVALGDLPAQRRVLGVHAGAARLRGVDVDLHQQPRRSARSKPR